MLNWRELIGLKPRIEDLANALLARARARGESEWEFIAADRAIRHPRGFTLNLGNIFLEYCGATRASRKALLAKYEAMMQGGETEIPKLWTLASKQIYPVVRSIYDNVTLEIMSRDGEIPMRPTLSLPLAGDLHIRVVFDHGQALARVDEELLETWGQSLEAVKTQALSNLRALERPRWEVLSEGVYQIVSDISYEESFLLVDAVVDALPCAGTAVLMAPNRGLLLACDRRYERALLDMLSHGEKFLTEHPWPLSAGLLERVDHEWREFKPVGQVAEAHAALERISLAITYNDQQSALQKHVGDDVFVATYSLIKKDDGVGGLRSWSSWTQGVPTLLPRTDIVAVGRAKDGDQHDFVMVPWRALEAICGARLKATREFPARFLVDDFPSEQEWTLLQREEERG